MTTNEAGESCWSVPDRVDGARALVHLGAGSGRGSDHIDRGVGQRPSVPPGCLSILVNCSRFVD